MTLQFARPGPHVSYEDTHAMPTTPKESTLEHTIRPWIGRTRRFLNRLGLASQAVSHTQASTANNGGAYGTHEGHHSKGLHADANHRHTRLFRVGQRLLNAHPRPRETQFAAYTLLYVVTHSPGCGLRLSTCTSMARHSVDVPERFSHYLL